MKTKVNAWFTVCGKEGSEVKAVLRTIFISIAMILMLTTGYADQNLPKGQLTKKKELVSAFKNTKFAQWQLYYPSDTEIVQKNMFSTHFYKRTNNFPMVAANGSGLAFCILSRNKDGSWKLSLSNEKALTRNGWSLTAFSIDSFSFEEETMEPMRLNFSFQSIENTSSYGISMQFNPETTEHCVIEYSIHDVQYPIESLGEYVIIRLLPDSIVFSSFNMEVLDFIDYEFCNFTLDSNVDRFSLSDVPYTPLDIMDTTILKNIIPNENEKIPVFQSLDDEEPTFFLSPDVEVYYAQSRKIEDTQYYVIEFEGRLGFIRK